MKTLPYYPRCSVPIEKLEISRQLTFDLFAMNQVFHAVMVLIQMP